MADQPKENTLKLGVMLGVFTPTVLTILGVIMFLRLGWVVGNAGLYGTLLIIVLANAITLITSLSMSSLATNMRVGVGGAYFLISRSFGLEVGGAIGIPLYLSQVLSVTLYAFGLAETVRFFWDDAPVAILAGVIVLGVTAIAGKSTEMTLKLQLPIMAFIGLALFSLVAGVEWGGSKVPYVGGWQDASFWEVFAVFFPAVTGVLAGLSLSGDLADPGKAIPRGVLSAVAVGAVVYLVLPFVLANAATAGELRENSLIWTQLAISPVLVMLGMWGAVLSSAFGSILSAPRTLQALASDRLAPKVFTQTTEDTGEPVIGLWFSGALAFLAVLLGDLNAVASWVTVFFLTTYGALNGVACLETLIADPSFRPRIRIKWWVSFAGAVGCFVAMFAINPLACFVAVVIEVGIFSMLSRRSLKSTWGDARSGLLLSGARYALIKLRNARKDPRNWRPHILVLTTDVTKSRQVVRMADNFGQTRGIVTLCHLLLGDPDDVGEINDVVKKNSRELAARGISAFYEVVLVSDVEQSIMTVAQANGIAGLHSNTVMFGCEHGQEEDRLARVLPIARRLATLQKCTLIFRPSERPVALPRRPEIVVWWAGRENNGDLMLLLAHLLSETGEWKGARIMLKSIVETQRAAEKMEEDLRQMIPESRIRVRTSVIIRDGEMTTAELITKHSARASLVFLGFSLPGIGEEETYAVALKTLLEGLPATILVHNAGAFRGRLV